LQVAAYFIGVTCKRVITLKRCAIISDACIPIMSQVITL